MDDRRFDGFVKALAGGKSRRSVLRGLLGVGGATLVGGAMLEGDADAARRPTPTPRPPSCPGKQTPCASGCCCPAGQQRCGSDCCATTIPSPQPGHSECCDSACCFGTCYGEELCCPTNNQPGNLPPIASLCADGQCCLLPKVCSTGACVDPTPASTPTSTSTSTPTATPTNTPTSTPTSVPPPATNTSTPTATNTPEGCQGACCADADCGDPCQICNLATAVCESRCSTGTVCCPGQAGAVVCVAGECCLGAPNCGQGEICCQRDSGTVCVVGDTCEPESDPCIECTRQRLQCCFINDTFVNCSERCSNPCIDICVPLALECCFNFFTGTFTGCAADCESIACDQCYSQDLECCLDDEGFFSECFDPADPDASCDFIA